MRRPIDILSAGEILIELATAEFVQTPDEVSLFKRIPGGSSANFAMNMARLGNKTILAACTGNDDMGEVLRNTVERAGVDVTYMAQVDEPTTIILTTRSAATSNYQIYRGADFQFSIRQFPFQRFEEISIFHTTCFALRRQPAQQVILQAAEKAKRAGCQLSIDANYVEKIWPDRRDAQRVMAELCRLKTLIKISDEDWIRLYEAEPPSPEAVIDHFLKMGASEICYTLGDKGCWVGNSDEKHFLQARKVDVKENSGAGDAFWAGYLTARLDGRTMLECSIAGRKMAEWKLAHQGTLPDKLDRAIVYEDLG